MSMEKQKIFWVILSVTVFVVVVLVVGLFLLKGRPDGLVRQPAAPPAAGSSTGIYEFGRSASPAGGDTEVLRFVIGDGGETEPPEAGPEGSGSAAAPSASAPTVEPAPVKPAAPAPSKPAVTPPSKPASSAAASTAAAAAARGPEYWIQTGSYKSQSRAEELSQSLAAKGLAGRVFSFAMNSETYFRVRIGPYANRQEADKFLAIVKRIEGLEASYISLVSASRSAN